MEEARCTDPQVWRGNMHTWLNYCRRALIHSETMERSMLKLVIKDKKRNEYTNIHCREEAKTTVFLSFSKSLNSNISTYARELKINNDSTLFNQS